MATTRKERAQSPTEPVRRVRCAVYCRKSNSEGLDSDFNSLVAQREACASYIASQASLGWEMLPTEYEDGGFSGSNTDRPGFQRLVADIDAGRIDAVILYKIDRLSRSLRDFGRVMELFEEHDVAFVSVTQRFDTSTSMGKLTLNILMSFAEFEREVTRERILDKVAGAKRKGMHCGGVAILGYDLDRKAKRLVVNKDEAKLVRRIFQRFVDLGSTLAVAAELNRDGYRTKAHPTATGAKTGGSPWDRSNVHRVLTNPKYLGLVEHRGKTFPGEHEAIVSQALWDEVQAILAEHSRERANRTRAERPALLKGVIRCATCGCSMMPSATRQKGRTYRYYRCSRAGKRGHGTCPVRSIAAGEIERAVVDQLRRVFRAPELVATTFRELKAREREETERLRTERGKLQERLRQLKRQGARLLEGSGGGAVVEDLQQLGAERDEVTRRLGDVEEALAVIETDRLTEREVLDALERLDPVWDSLFPGEQARIVGLLVERVEVQPDGLEVRLRADGLRSLVAEVAESPAEAETR